MMFLRLFSKMAAEHRKFMFLLFFYIYFLKIWFQLSHQTLRLCRFERFSRGRLFSIIFRDVGWLHRISSCFFRCFQHFLKIQISAKSPNATPVQVWAFSQDLGSLMLIFTFSRVCVDFSHAARSLIRARSPNATPVQVFVFFLSEDENGLSGCRARLGVTFTRPCSPNATPVHVCAFSGRYANQRPSEKANLQRLSIRLKKD